jgi:phage FluMu protein Com
MNLLRINYGINRRRPGARRRAIENDCGKLEVTGDWGDDNTHGGIRYRILRRHPNPEGYPEWLAAQPDDVVAGIAAGCLEVKCPKCGKVAAFVRDRGFPDGSGKVYMCQERFCPNWLLYFYPPNPSLP